MRIYGDGRRIRSFIHRAGQQVIEGTGHEMNSKERSDVNRQGKAGLFASFYYLSTSHG